MLPTPIQPTIHGSKVLYFVPFVLLSTPCAIEHAKEKEKNTTIFTICHGELLTIMSDYLLNNMSVY